jgi:hypothetical protein
MGFWQAVEIPNPPKRNEWATLTPNRIFGHDPSATGEGPNLNP